MSETIEAPIMVTEPTRMTRCELDKLWPALLPRLRDLWPFATDAQTRNHLILACEDPSSLFLQCGEAVGLAQRIDIPVNEFKVDEIFMLCSPDKKEEAWEIYRAMQRWCVGMRCTNFGVGRYGEISHVALREFFGGLNWERLAYIKLELPGI